MSAAGVLLALLSRGLLLLAFLQLVFLAPHSVSAAPFWKMGWEDITLNDGTKIPSVAFGTWLLGNGDQAVGKVDQAISAGFSHIDTAQSYGNEQETGRALRDSGLSRDDLYITTKYSGVNGLSIDESIRNSVNYLGVQSVDLYLIHNPGLAVPDIPTVWSQMEKAKQDGLTKSIGVSNFEIEHLEILLQSAKIKPVVNQIYLNPYALVRQAPLMEYCAKHKIIIEAYSPLVPVTREPGGPVDAPLKSIADRLNAAPEQVLLAWAKAKGTVVVTSSSRKDRVQRYIEAGNLKLTDDDVKAIDDAAASRVRRDGVRKFLYRTVVVTLVGAVLLGVCGYFDVDIL